MAEDNETNGPKHAITVFGSLDASHKGSPAEPLTIDLTATEASIDSPKAGPTDAEAAASPASRWDRISPLAASIVTALLIGGFAGAAATYELSRQTMPVVAAAAVADETLALQETVTKLSTELAAIKASVERANRASTQQLVRIGERLDRAEKVQAEPAAKLAKISESLDRLERRVAAAPSDVTGSITTVEKQDSKPPVVEGWRLRDYYAGRAVLESRNGTLFEVGPGSNLPGLGRIETIRRVDGKVVVTTPKGIITSSLEARRPPYFLPHGR